MFQPGLVSVTFTQLTCEDVIRFAQAAQLKVIEWHGIEHVPHGDLGIAERIAQCTVDAGLAVATYGSYYVVGESENQGLSFASVLQTAKALHARMIRVWAGHLNPGGRHTRLQGDNRGRDKTHRRPGSSTRD